MKAIISIVCVIAGSSYLYGQGPILGNKTQSRIIYFPQDYIDVSGITFTSVQDSFVCSFEDYLGNASKKEREIFESIYNYSGPVYSLDRLKEVRLMLELFGESMYTTDENGMVHLHKFGGYINQWVGNYSWGFDEWEPYLDDLQSKLDTTINQSPYIMDQLWSNRNMAYYSNGHKATRNFTRDSYYYISEISEFNVEYDQQRVPYIPNLGELLKEVERFSLQDPMRYKSLILLLFNMRVKSISENQINLIAKKIKDGMYFADFGDQEKADILLATNKLLLYSAAPIHHDLIASNFGHLYGLLVHDREKFNLVRIMEVEYLNYLAFDYSHQNLLTYESFRIFEDLFFERNVYPIPFEFHLSIAEIISNELIECEEKPGDPLYDKLIVNLEWRIISIIHELETRKTKEHIPTYIYDRFFKLLVVYYATLKDTSGMINVFFKNLKDQQCSNLELSASIPSFASLLRNISKGSDRGGWLQLIPINQRNPFTEKIINQIQGDKTNTFIDLSEEDKKLVVNVFTDIIQINDSLEISLSDFSSELNSLNLTELNIPRIGQELLTFADYCYEQGEYKTACYLLLISNLATNEEKDISTYSSFVQNRDRNESEVRRNKLLNEKFNLQQENDNLVNTNKYLLNEIERQKARLESLSHKNKSLDSVIESKSRELEDAVRSLKQKESLLLMKKSEISKVENDLKALKKDYGDEQAKVVRIEKEQKKSQFYLILTISLLIIASFFLGLSVRYGIRVKKEKEKVLTEKRNVEKEKEKVLTEKRNVEKEKEKVIAEQKKTKALQLSIYQMTHFCKEGVDNLLRNYLSSDSNFKQEKGRDSLGALVDTFQKFCENSNLFIQSIRGELAFADSICKFQFPELEVQFLPSNLMVYNRYLLEERQVPIYTLVNILTNSIQHSKLDESVQITVEENPDSTLYIRSYAELKPTPKGRESSGMKYVAEMVELISEDRTNDFKHGPTTDGYLTKLPIPNERKK